MKKIFIILGSFLLFLTFTNTVYADSAWNLNDSSPIVFGCGSGSYHHTLDTVTVNLTSGSFVGEGTYDPNSSYTWDITGNITGNDITFTIVYTGSNAGYTLNGVGTISADGSIAGTVGGNCQTFSMSAGTASFNRHAEITSPDENEDVYGFVNFSAYLTDDDADSIQWAVREGTCAAAVGTVFGNVGGHSDVATINISDLSMQTFEFSGDMSSMTPGEYCFIYNPREDSGESNIRETREFNIIEDTTAPIITFVEPVSGSTHSGLMHLKATCNEDCNYVNFWWRAEGESFSSSSKRYHYVHTDGTVFEWDLNTLNAERADGSNYLMSDGVYYLYAAGKDLAGNWARTSTIRVIVDNAPNDKNECKKGGWKTFINPSFKNQGSCVSYVQSNDHAGKRP